MELKIDTRKLNSFLEKCRMGEVESCLLDFKDDGLHVSMVSGANTHSSKGFLKSDAFKEYASIGTIGVDDLSKLMRVLKRVGNLISFTITGNLLTAKSDKKSLNVELVDEKFIDKPKPLPELEFVTQFNIKAGQLFDFLTDVQLNKDATISIETRNGGVIFTNTGKYKFKHMIDSEGTKEGVVVKFGLPFMEALQNLKEGEMILKVKNDYPILVEYIHEEEEIKFMVAPRSDD